jgi:hypothetical protein
MTTTNVIDEIKSNKSLVIGIMGREETVTSELV